MPTMPITLLPEPPDMRMTPQMIVGRRSTPITIWRMNFFLILDDAAGLSASDRFIVKGETDSQAW